jgi:hypothetical protein
MKHTLFVLAFFLLHAVDAVSAEPTFDRRMLLGTWEYKAPGTFKSLTGYTTYKADGTCIQIARGKALGMTKWIFLEMRWRLEGDQIPISIVRSNIGVPVGKTDSSRILRLSDSEFTYRESDGTERTERHVSTIPEEFRAQLETLQRNVKAE